MGSYEKLGKMKAKCTKCGFEFIVKVYEINNQCPKCGNGTYMFLEKDITVTGDC